MVSVNGASGQTDHTDLDYRLTLCAVFEQSLGHLEPQRAPLSRRLPCNFQALCRTSAVKYDCVDHSEVVPKTNHTTSEQKHILTQDWSIVNLLKNKKKKQSAPTDQLLILFA